MRAETLGFHAEASPFGEDIVLLVTTDPALQVGETSEQLEQGRSRLELDLESLPGWTGRTRSEVLGRLGAAYQVEPEATFATIEVMGEGPTTIEPTTAEFEAIAPRAPVPCQEELNGGLEEIFMVVDNIERISPEARRVFIEDRLPSTLERTAAAITSCTDANPDRQQEYQYILATAYWVAGLLELFVESDHAQYSFEQSCELGLELACGDSISKWSLETCPAPYFTTVGRAATELEAGTTLTRDDITLGCGPVLEMTDQTLTDTNLEEHLGRISTRAHFEGEVLEAQGFEVP